MAKAGTGIEELRPFELFTSIEMNILPILAEMEIEGIHVDTQKLSDYRIELVENIEKVQTKF